MHFKRRQCVLGGRAVTMVAFLEKYCSWVEGICKRRSANGRGFPRGHPRPGWIVLSGARSRKTLNHMGNVGSKL